MFKVDKKKIYVWYRFVVLWLIRMEFNDKIIFLI